MRRWRINLTLGWGMAVLLLFVFEYVADVGVVPWQFVAVGTVLSMAITALE